MVLPALLLLAPDFSAYRTWVCVTPQAVDMAPEIALSCIGPASWDSSSDNPHVRKRFKVWVNPIGKATMGKELYREVRKGEWKPVPSRFPAGTIIVKEKFDASVRPNGLTEEPSKPIPKQPELLTIMVKGSKGSKPKTGDWSYYVANGVLQKIDQSQEARCASCHAARKERDFTFRNYGHFTH